MALQLSEYEVWLTERGTYAESTLQLYIHFAKDIAAKRMTPKAWVDAEIALGYSTSSVRVRRSAAQSLWRWLQEQNIGGIGPYPEAPKRGGPRADRPFLTKEELARYLEVVRTHPILKPPLRMALQLAPLTAMRLEEACTLRRHAFRRIDGVFGVDAGFEKANFRFVPLHPVVRSLLREYLATEEAGDEWLLPSAPGSHLPVGNAAAKLALRLVKTKLGWKEWKAVNSRALQGTLAHLLREAKAPDEVVEAFALRQSQVNLAKAAKALREVQFPVV